MRNALVIAWLTLAMDSGAVSLTAVCAIRVHAILNTWSVTEPFRKIPPDRPGEKAYRVPTATLGRWVEVRETKGRVQLARISRKVWEEVSLASPQCEEKQQRRVLSSRPLQNVFSDTSLKAILQKHDSGIIYAWTPHMPLSLLGVTEIRKAAKEMSIPVFFTLDPHADRTWAKREVARHSLDREALRSSESLELLYRGALDHFPAVLVFKKGRLGRVVPGFKNAAFYEAWVKKESERLRK